MSTQNIISQINDVAHEIDGVTFLGGEPFEYAEELSLIANYIHSLNKNVITFTGYTYEELIKTKAKIFLLNETDLLIDGRFEKSLLDYSRPLVGSSNQKFVFISNRILPEEIEKYKNRFEVRFDNSGKIQFNGMGNIQKLQEILKCFEEKENE